MASEWRTRGAALLRAGDLQSALECWQDIAAHAPGDQDAARTLSRIVIEISRRAAGLEPHPLPIGCDDAPAGDAPSPASSDAALPAPVAGPAITRRGAMPAKLTPLQQLELTIRDQPSNVEAYLTLAPMYLEKERDYDAERLLEKGKEATGDLRVRELWEEVVIRRLEKKIEFLRKEAERDDTPEHRTELAQLRAERDRFAISVFSARCERSPDNMNLRHRLGLHMARAGKLEAACQQFRQALDDPAVGPAAAFELGQCLAEFFDYPEAIEHFRLAADAAVAAGQVELRKEALFRAAELASRVKLRGPTRRYLSELVQIDPQYRNAAALLDQIPQRARV